MALLGGYVLEPIRVGRSNSPFTQTPDIYVSNQADFDTAYPSDESVPRADYLVLVTSEGSPAGLLEAAKFGWTKNEIIDRFDYDSKLGRFKPLPGSFPTLVGTLTTSANTTRLKVKPPARMPETGDPPFRISVGSVGSGTTFPIDVVLTDGDFTAPASGRVRLSFDTGNLHWNTSDLTANAGQIVRYQQQQFYGYKDSTGKLGEVPSLLGDYLILSPIPGSGQIPLIRFGYGFYLNVQQVADESSLGTPSAGTVNWALDTGMLRFNVADVGKSVYYDGVLFSKDSALSPIALGTVDSPSALPLPLPSDGVDLIFTVPGFRFPKVEYVSAFTSGKAGTVQVNRTTGDVQFSTADQVSYSGQAVTAYYGDLEIEHGVSVRLFRTPVNLDGSSDVKDVAAIYSVTGASWADPIIASPQVILPSTPIQDPAYPLTIKILQGQGSYTDNNFPVLSVSISPGLGYYIDYDSGSLYFAQRFNQLVLPSTQVFPDSVQLDSLLLDGSLTLERESLPGSGTYVPLVVGSDAIVDNVSGIVSLTTTNDALDEGTASISGTVLTDPNAQFTVAGVQPGHFVEVLTTTAKGVYTVQLVPDNTHLVLDISVSPSVVGAAYRVFESREILADRYFDAVTLVDPSTSIARINFLGTVSNSPRLSVPTSRISKTGIRFGDSTGSFATMVIVPDDSSFTAPVGGTVQISEATGNLNFSAADLGLDAFWARTLDKSDYALSPDLGLVQLTDRLLSKEEVLITYTVEPPTTDPVTPLGNPVTEYASFLIRKELTQDHPTPTSTLNFNTVELGEPHPLPVASTPAPAVFRGGRPQKIGEQCTVDVVSSTITFLSDSQITDALPHGATIAPTERVYIDYYVTQAVGGEKTFTVSTPPIHVVRVLIQDADSNGNPVNQFTVSGDQTANFPANHLLRIETSQVYLIGGSSFSDGKTTVTLAGSNQYFQDSFTDPQLYVASGPTTGSYFSAEMAAFEAIARGSNTFFVQGDRTLSYRPGTVLLFTDSGGSFTDYLLVSGSSFDGARTTVMLGSNAIRQYVTGQQLLNYSVRPVFEFPTTTVQTSRQPVLSQPYSVYRRRVGEAGISLSSPSDYTIDETGHIVFTDPLLPNEEFSIFYTGRTTLLPGVHVRASYTHQISPNQSNGLLGQTLLADYAILSPDSFYYRVEKMTNFRSEYSKEISAAASSGSSGPQTSNTSQPKLFEQGQKSLYFDERHLSNQDLIARSTLLFYNDLINYLEEYRRETLGVVVGNNDGKFLFDGTSGSVQLPSTSTNQIDDSIKISDAPYTYTFGGGGWTATSIGTYRKYYLPGPFSRFYPTAKNFFAVAVVSNPPPSNGTDVADTGSKHVLGASNLHTRQAWAQLTFPASAGETLLTVDHATGDSAYVRPPFTTGRQIVVQNRDGSIVSAGGTTITGSPTATGLQLSNALTGTAYVGATVYQLASDSAITNYQGGRDYGLDQELGQITYIGDDGNGNSPFPSAPSQEPLSGSITLTNTLTEPYKFPALFGGIEDDDGDLSFPIQSPATESELTSLTTEQDIIQPSTGLIRTVTTPSFEAGTGTVSGANTFTITGTAPSPALSVGDLVRITSGANADLAHFRKVTNLSPVTVTGPALVAGTFSYEATVCNNVLSGVVAIGSTTTTVNAISFSGAKVGHTLVITSGAHANSRVQITAVSPTSVDIDPPLAPAPLAGVSFHVDNPLATYGGNGTSHYLATLQSSLDSTIALYSDQQATLFGALGQTFTIITFGTVALSPSAVFVDPLANFAGVSTSDYLYIPSGPNFGLYAIQSVDSATQLTLASPLPSADGPTLYTIVSVFGLSVDSLTTLLALIQSIQGLIDAAAAFRNLTNAIDVYALPGSATTSGEFATGLTTSAMNARALDVSSRLADLSDIGQQVADILASSDDLYDARYVWIDTRVNLEKGLLVQQELAIANRIKAQADILKQLTKLIAVGV